MHTTAETTTVIYFRYRLVDCFLGANLRSIFDFLLVAMNNPDMTLSFVFFLNSLVYYLGKIFVLLQLHPTASFLEIFKWFQMFSWNGLHHFNTFSTS